MAYFRKNINLSKIHFLCRILVNTNKLKTKNSLKNVAIRVFSDPYFSVQKQRKPVLVNFWRSEEEVRTFGILYFQNKIDCAVRKTLFCKKGVFKHFPKILREALFRSFFIMKLQAVGLQFYWNEIRNRVFSWSFMKICKRTFL